MNPRIRRLLADARQIKQLDEQHPNIALDSAEGDPPERYTFTLKVQGLIPVQNAAPQAGDSFKVEVFLPLEYPRRPPFCRMLSPVYHPNIDPQKICIGDHWSAGQTLPSLIVQIAEMIAFQSYNTKSPLNGEAAAWVEQNEDRLPIDTADFARGVL